MNVDRIKRNEKKREVNVEKIMWSKKEDEKVTVQTQNIQFVLQLAYITTEINPFVLALLYEIQDWIYSAISWITPNNTK